MREINLIDLMCGVSSALDYISTSVTGHHRRVALGAAVMGNDLGIENGSLLDLIQAGLLHDIGAFSLEGLTLDRLHFEASYNRHAEMGARLLQEHKFLKRASLVVRYHHTDWEDLLKVDVDEETRVLANVINLADRVDILRRVGGPEYSREQVEHVIARYPASEYSPQVIQAFGEAARSGVFWPLVEELPGSARELLNQALLHVSIPREQLLSFSKFFSRVIDFRSRHTATHSVGVARTAVELARLAGMDEEQQQLMRLAGNLHDIGKLAVPMELLDKPAKLDPDEYKIIQNHAVVSERVLRSIPGLDEVADWACQHHERLNGQGYPHGLKGEELSLGSRIMQVADVYTAITEDRPYRVGMSQQRAHEVLQSMADGGFLDPGIVRLVTRNLDRINGIRKHYQERAAMDFQRFFSGKD